MGLFDELDDLLKPFREIKDEMVDLAVDVVKEVRTEADDIKETVTGTADELKNQAEDLKGTVTDAAANLKGQAQSQADDIQARFRDAAGLKPAADVATDSDDEPRQTEAA